MNEHAQPIARTRLVLIALMTIVATAVLITHRPALSAQAMSCDDKQYLVDNYLVRNPSWASAGRAVREVLEPSTVAGYYQPLAMISLMIDSAMGGGVDNLAPFHRTSLILHVANTLLVVLFLYLLFGQPWPAAVVGLLFGLHPLTVEPIPWVGERKTLLAAFFALVALCAYVRYAQTMRWGYLVGVLVGYVLALLSKPTSTPLPLAMLLLDFWPLNRWGRRSVLEKIPLLAVGAVSAIITVVSQDRTASTVMPTEVPLFHSLLRCCHNVVFYLEKMVWPANLSSHYPIPEPFSLADRGLLMGLIGVLVLAPALIISARYSRAFVTGAAIYLFLLLPTVQIVGFSDAIAADKYAYLPALGVLIVLAWLLGRWTLFSWSAARRPAVLLAEIVLIVVVTGEAFATRRYLADWKDTESLCRRMLALTPQAASVHSHFGLYLAGQGRLDEAVAQYEEALKYDPDHVEARNNLGNAYSDLGRPREAFACWVQTLQKHPNNYTASYNLGTWFAEHGQVGEAMRYLELAVRLRPSSPQAHTNLAVMLIQQGRIDEAYQHLKQSVALWPYSATAQHYLATLLLRWGRLDEAIAHYAAAVRANPQSADMHYHLAEALRQAQRFDEAAREFREALRLAPDHDAARAGLASIAEAPTTQRNDSR